MSATAPRALPGQRTVVSLISAGHCYSHLSSVAVAPLFPALREAFDVSYVALGALMTVFSIATSVAQIPVGLAVDRYGGRPVLVIGLVLLGGSLALAGGAEAYWQVVALFALAGLGNSVFHPADLSILARRVDRAWLGRTVSLHSFVGYVGWAIAPMSIAGLNAAFGWRGALLGAGIAGLAVAALIQWRRTVFDDEPGAGAAGETKNKERFDIRARLMAMTDGPMIRIFLFFLFTSMTIGGLAGFLAIAMMELFGADLAGGNLALTAFMVTMACAVLFGGVLADRISAHDRLAAWTVAGGAAALALLAFGLGGYLAGLAVIAASGFLLGVSSPSRDLIVRARAPAGSLGLAFGFTSTGLSIGFALGPIAVGGLMDLGRPDLAILVLAAVSGLAVLALAAGRRTVPAQ
ncbi:MAG: MFS transporter [Defluviicoccus sp.]|nr:MFS transporter [Defluviicoccus sp.]